jgi:hypothetical protein
MKKTFKIGECALGGIITVEAKSKPKENQAPFHINFLDWNSKQIVASYHAYSTEDIYDVHSDNTTHYWADRITSHFN